jgi:hypothetical protein
VEVSRRLAGNFQQLGTTYEFREIPGGTHPDAGRVGAPWMFSFFDKHKKSTAAAEAGLLTAASPSVQPMNGTMIPLPSALRDGTATMEQVRAWLLAEHTNVYPEIPVDQVPFPVRELDLDLDGKNDALIERYRRDTVSGPRSAFLNTARGYRFIGTFYGDIRPLSFERGQPSRFVITSAMKNGSVHVRLAVLRADGLHQMATAIIAAGDGGTADGNRLYREIISADVLSSGTLRKIFGDLAVSGPAGTS